jgi:hypothetical protein
MNENTIPAIYNLTGNKAIRKGRWYGWQFVLPWAVSGNTYAAKIKDADGTLIATFLIETDIVNNKVTINLTGAVTALLAAGMYRWDLKQTDSLANPINIIEGQIEVKAAVT